MTLKRGSTGSEVSAWQTFLRGQGFGIEVDGVFGLGTEDATKAFQRSRGLTPDGLVGPATAAAAAPAAATPAAPSSSPAPAASGRLTSRGRELIKGFEGLVLTAYPDGKNGDGSPKYSVGYGHNGVAKGTTITRADADRYFDADVARFEAAVLKAAPRAEPHEFDAMVSLAYNIGSDAFSKSTVARRHGQGDTTGAADAILMWNKADGAINKTLERRRERERAVYLHANYSGPIDPGAPAPPKAPPRAAGGGGLIALVVLGAGVAAAMLRR